MIEELEKKTETVKIMLMWVLCINVCALTITLAFMSRQLSEINDNLWEIKKSAKAQSNLPQQALAGKKANK